MRIRSTVHVLSVAVGLALFTPSVQGQAPAISQTAADAHVAATAAAGSDVAQVEPAGPRRQATVVGVRADVADTPLPAPLQARRNNTSTAATLTIVGTAAFIGGLLIGDDVGTAIAVGGLAAGLIGLYMWLR